MNALVRSVRESPDGHLVDGAQLGFQIDANFFELFQGRRLDVAPLVESLRGVDGFTERSIYAALVVAYRTTSDLEIELLAPPIELSDREMSEVVTEVRARAKDRQRVEAGIAPSAARGKAEKASPGQTGSLAKRDARLRRYHLLGISPKRLQLLRQFILLVTVVGLGAFAWLKRPDRPLNPGPFPLPLRSAELRDGQFIGHLHDAVWYRQPPSARERIVLSMENALREARLLNEALIFDAQGRVMARGAGGRLRGSRWLLESPDGRSSPPQGESVDPLTGSTVKSETEPKSD